MAFQRPHGAGGRVPDPNLPVKIAGRKKSAFGRKGHRIDATAKLLKKLVLTLLALLLLLLVPTGPRWDLGPWTGLRP